MDTQQTSPAIDAPDTSFATARAEVIAAARAVVRTWYYDSSNRMTGDLMRRLADLEYVLAQLDETPPDA